MQSYSLFCSISKINYKNKSLVAIPASRLFLFEDLIDNLVGIQVYVVPPKLDFPRSFIVDSAKLLDNKMIEITLKGLEEKADLQKIINCNLLLKEQDLNNIINMPNNSIVNIFQKKVIDKKFGYVGNVEDIVENPSQTLLVVRKNNEEYLIPYVDDIVKNINESVIDVELPNGLLEINC